MKESNNSFVINSWQYINQGIYDRKVNVDFYYNWKFQENAIIEMSNGGTSSFIVITKLKVKISFAFYVVMMMMLLT